MNIEDEIGIDFDNFDMAKELLLFEDCIIKPTDVLIRLYIKPMKTKGGIIMNNSKGVYEEISGYVAKMGKACFNADWYKDWGHWYKTGDWVVFPRHAGIRYTYKNLPVFSIPDDSPLMIISDPREVR
jgi:co-chaperonin GroES (HSP10)